MKIELDRKGLEILVYGSQPYYNEFNNPLVKKAGHSYLIKVICGTIYLLKMFL